MHNFASHGGNGIADEVLIVKRVCIRIFKTSLIVCSITTKIKTYFYQSIIRCVSADTANCAMISPHHNYTWIDQGCSVYQTGEPICEKR